MTLTSVGPLLWPSAPAAGSVFGGNVFRVSGGFMLLILGQSLRTIDNYPVMSKNSISFNRRGLRGRNSALGGILSQCARPSIRSGCC